MSKEPLYIAFVWHMHQPYYKDLTTGKYVLPWVRLHGIKDYYDMVAILEEFPEIKQTFNLVPSLLEQIIDYVHHDATDKYLDLTLKPASELTPQEKIFVLHDFFLANWDTMVKIYPRYNELLHKRGYHTSLQDLEGTYHTFSTQDYLDLQAWFNLAWFDPLFKEKDPLLVELIKKGKDFTEDEKLTLVEKQKAVLATIIPTYKRLYDSGQIEISTSPFYHPILPLLCDTNSAKIATPDIQLPNRRFSHPEDARKQIDMAISFHKELFGKEPKGMWPSEGSVSEDILPLIIEAGIKWIATDEEILAQSLKTDLSRETRETIGIKKTHKLLYRPYLLSREKGGLTIIFRDHQLSDLIGFLYSKMEPHKAAEDFIHRLHTIQEALPSHPESNLLTIILDGENAWEYYKNDGRDFLLFLYKRLSKDPRIRTTTVSDYLHTFPPKETLSTLYAGSWINHNFRIWIGDEEDNMAWDLLSEARNTIVEAELHGKVGKDKILTAWKEVYIAEGSDWCWWYGDDHSSGNDEAFDELFRKHLMNIYNLIDKPIPDNLRIAILKEDKKVKPTKELVGFLSPHIDGYVTNYFEWLPAGFYDVGKSGGTMHQAESIVSYIYYGFDLSNLFLRLDTKLNLREEGISELFFIVHFLKPQQRRLRIKMIPEKDRVEALFFKKEDDEWKTVSDLNTIAAKEIVELSMPFSLIKAGPNEEVQFFITVRKDGIVLEKWPFRGFISFQVPTEEFEASKWYV